MKRLMTALVVIAASAFAIASVAQAKHEQRHHRSTLATRLAKWEHRFHFKLTKANALADADGDGVSNVQEFVDGTNPLAKDTNGAADATGDHDNDGIPNDMDTAATVKSFTPATATAPAVLVISLPDGTTETGQVTNQTEIDCEAAPVVMTTPTAPTAPTVPNTARDHGGDNQGSGDNGNDNDANNNNNNGDDNNDNSGSGPGPSGQGNQSGQGGNDSHDGGRGDDGNDNDNEMPCTTAALTVGASVHSAELRITSAGVVFNEIELIS
jgi:hypothetical protein